MHADVGHKMTLGSLGKRRRARASSDRGGRLFDAFIPEELRTGSSDDATRARIVVWCGLLAGGLAVGVASPSSLFVGQPRIAAINAITGLLCMAVPFVMRVTKSLPIAASGLMAVMWAQMVILYLGTSDGSPSTLYSMAVVPLGATLLAGPRAGLFWLGMVVVTVVGLHFSSAWGWSTPVPAFVSNPEIELFMARDVLLLACAVAGVGIYYDIQRGRAVREASQERLRADESDARFERAFASNPDAIAIWRVSDGRVVECNEGFVRALGLARRDIIDRLDWCEAFGVDDAERARLLAAIPDADDGVGFETTSPAQGDASPRIHLVSATTIELDDEACVLATARDITRQRELDEQLRQSQKMEAVGQLAGSVAHDFNNMLTVILGYSSELGDSLVGSDHEKVERIDGAARRAASLTHQLLAFSRREVVQPRAIDLNEAIRNLSSMLRRLLGAEVELSLELDERAPFVSVDPGQLDQVLVNLAINARDAMPSGGTITLRSRSDAPPPGRGREGAPAAWCAIDVVDEGGGMDAETLRRAVEPFFTTKPRGAGTGLGLSTAHGMVGQSGGELRLESRPGRGTKATIHLRVVDPGEDGPQVEPPTDAARDDAPATILLVEDEAQVRQLGRRLLERAGHHVVTASNGEEALAIARERERPFDVVVTDVVMPRMNGLALARAIFDEWPDLPVLFISGYADPTFAGVDELPEGAEFLAKPFTASALIERVGRLLEARSRSGAPRTG